MFVDSVSFNQNEPALKDMDPTTDTFGEHGNTVHVSESLGSLLSRFSIKHVPVSQIASQQGNVKPGLINPGLINRGCRLLVGIHHFWREHPPNNGTCLLILGQHYLETGKSTYDYFRWVGCQSRDFKIGFSIG